MRPLSLLAPPRLLPILTGALLTFSAAAHAQDRNAFAGLTGGFAPADHLAYLSFTTSTVSTPVTANTIARGAYTADGTMSAGYSPLTGITGSTESRGFYLFDFSIIGGTAIAVTNASLTVSICHPAVCGGTSGYVSPNTSETIDIWDYSGAANALTGGTGGTWAFADLGSGLKLGSAILSASSLGYEFVMNFNADGFNALQNAFLAKGQLVIGTALAPTPGTPTEPTDPQQPPTTVPEPTTWALLAAGLTGLVAIKRRRTT